MADPAIEFLIRQIEALLKDEISLLAGAKTSFNEIIRELEFMKSFLKDADNMRKTTSVFKTWVEAVRGATYDVEDVIDTFTYSLGRRRKNGCFHLLKYLYDKHTIATKLLELKAELKSISERAIQYGFDRISEEGSTSSYTDPGGLQHHRESPIFIQDDKPVGIDKQSEVLVEWLLEDDQRRTVISVHGMGGSGKTTLAAKVYQSQTIRTSFNCFAWITVSQTYDKEDLYRDMIKEFYKNRNLELDLSTATYGQLVGTIIEFVRPKRYFIVFDDVWDVNLLSAFNIALYNEHGSRIMLTTRNEEIARASSIIGGHVHQLQSLQDDVACRLFCKKAFPILPTPNSKCCAPSELQVVAHLIVKKCEGLPLAILAMGGMMSSKSATKLEWEKVYESLNWKINNNLSLQPMKSILSLSYNELPSYLKPCFLFCCVFPEDYVIHRDELIQLWVAEGFVEERSGMTQEQVADTYLRELISRSMLQVNWRDSNHCLMHDLMRELALSTSKKESFCVVYEKSKDGEARKDCRAPRRLSSREGVDASKLSCFDISQLRSFYMFPAKYTGRSGTSLSAPCSEGSLILPPGFKLLKVLDLQGIPITSLPDELVDLFNLRYLNISRSKVKELPKSIGRLRNLQTLNISRSKVKELPKSIGRLRNLQTLDISYSSVEALPNEIVKLNKLQNMHIMRYPMTDYDGPTYKAVDAYQAPTDICKLTNLRELELIEANGDTIKQVGNMTQLRKFGVCKVTEAQTKDLCSTFQNLTLLHSLTVVMANEDELLNLDTVSSPPPSLQELVMFGKLEKVPLWFASLNNLSSLYLHWSRLGEDLLIHIHSLPCLGHLILVNAYHGQQLCFRPGWFPHLNKILRVKNFPHLNKMIIENGAMPYLEKLVLDSCNELKTIPDGIEHLKELQWLNLEDMPNAYITSFYKPSRSSLARALNPH